jgi:hypothetical protein
MEKVRPEALVHWSFNISFFFLLSVWTGFEVQKFQPAAHSADTTHISGVLAIPMRSGG